jgi:hypothetical protein
MRTCSLVTVPHLFTPAVPVATLQVSEKIVTLDEELKQLQVHEGELHAKMETLAREKTQLMAAADELRAEVADKMELLDEFEDRFKRQYRWGGGEPKGQVDFLLRYLERVHPPWQISCQAPVAGCRTLSCSICGVVGPAGSFHYCVEAIASPPHLLWSDLLPALYSFTGPGRKKSSLCWPR